MRLGKALLAVGAGTGAAYGYALWRLRRFEDLSPETAGAPGSFIDVDGAVAHYVEAGQGDPVVLIHGLAGSTFSFRYTIPELARYYRVIALDLRGFGFSQRGSGDYSLGGQAGFAATFLSRLGVDRATFVGHSMGGGVAQRLALRDPTMVERLVLVDTVTSHERRRARAGRLLQVMAPFLAMVTLQSPAFMTRALRGVVHDPQYVTPEVVDGYTRPFRLRGSLRSMQAVLRSRHDESVSPQEILQPTLVLWGEHDRLLPPSHGEELANQIPEARFAVVRGAGHLPLEEQPDESSRLLLEFLRPAATSESRSTPSSVETPT